MIAGMSSQPDLPVLPSPISSNNINQIRERLVQEYRQFPSNLKRDGTAEMNISSGEETRYILELLQNADDAQFPSEGSSDPSLEGKLTFVITANCLYCANTGYPITVDGLKALCDSFLSTKTRSKPTIGFKGIGYKSVLGITESPSIFWHNGCVGFSKEDAWKIFVKVVPNVTKEQIPILRYPIDLSLDTELIEDSILKELWKTHTTVFRFPFRKGIKTEEVWARLQEVTPSTLLFTHHLAKVEIKALDLPYSSVSFDIIRKHSTSFAEMEHTVITTEGIKSSWLVAREMCTVPDSERPLFPRDAQDVRAVEVAVALEVNESTQRVKPYNLGGQFPKLHVFFPTDQIVPFRILLHGNFRTNIDRRTVTDDLFNRFIISKAASLIATKVIDIVKNRIKGASDLIDFFEQPSLDNWFQKTLSEEVIALIKTKPIIQGDATLGWLTPAEVLHMPSCIDGTRFRKLVPGFEFKVKSNWKKTCTEEAEKGVIRRGVLMALGATELDPLELPGIIEGYNRVDPAWVGESYALLEKTYNYMLTTRDLRYTKFKEKALTSKLLFTSDHQFVQAALPKEEGIIFAPPESEVTILTPPKTRLRFLDRKSLQIYLAETGKTFRQCFLHEELGVKEYATDDVIAGAIIPEIREFWRKRPALTHFGPKKMLDFLLDLLGDLLDSDPPKFNISRTTNTLELQSLPVQVKHPDLYAQAYKVYFPKEWTGTEDLEEIYGLGESYFLDLPPESFPEEKRTRAKRLLEALGVSTLPKIKGQFLPDQDDAWRQQGTWDRNAKLFPGSPHAGLPGWNEYCREISSLLDQDGSGFDYNKASILALQSSYELDRFDMIVRDRRRAEHLLKLIASNRAYFDQYMYCDIWHIISKITGSKKFPSYFMWQLKNAPWIPTISSGKSIQDSPGKAYLSTPSLRRLFHDTIPYVSLTNELKPKSDIVSLLRFLGVRESIDQLEPSDWWKVAATLPSVYKDRLNEAVAEEEIRAVYRAMLDRPDCLENDIPERLEFIREGKLLAIKGQKLGFYPATDVWYTEVDRYEQLFDLPIFTIKRQYNRGPAISRVFKLRWIEEELVAKETTGPVVDSASELLNNLLSEVAPFFLSRLSVEIAVSTQEQVISRLRRLRSSAVDGLTVEYTLKTEANSYHKVREEPLLLKSEGTDYTLIVNTKVLLVLSNELPIEAAHKIGTELVSYLHLSSSIGYEFAELLRMSEPDRFKTLASAFDIKEETIEHFRNTFNDEHGTIEIFIPEVENNSDQKKPLPTPYQTLEPQIQRPVHVWSLDDLQFGSIQAIKPVNGSTVTTTGPSGHHYKTGPAYLKDEELKNAIETTGQRLVEKWLGTVGGYVDVRDVHTENKGWDVEAKKDGTTFLFEVKSSGSNVNVIEITMKEWQKAQAKREKYYLVQVTNLAYASPETANRPELLVIRNPYNVLAANPTRFRVKLSEFRRYDALEVKRILTLNDSPDQGSID